jgi:hypothetical protein
VYAYKRYRFSIWSVILFGPTIVSPQVTEIVSAIEALEKVGLKIGKDGEG